MAGVKRTITASGAWLTRSASDMADALAQRSGDFLTSQKIVDGYVVIAKKAQLMRGKLGVPSHMQAAQVRNSVRLSALVMDLPAFVCLPGKYIPAVGKVDPDKAYVQTLSAGRDSYLPGSLTDVLPLQLEPLERAGPYTSLIVGSSAVTANRVPARFWGVSQPFEGVGCVYGYGAVYLTNDSPRWSLTWGKLTDAFVYRLVMLAPSALRYETTDGVEVMTPEVPTGAGAAWSLEISESMLVAIGAKAFTRFEGADPTYGLDPLAGGEVNWEPAQYPWFTFSQPKMFVSDSGDSGFRVVIAAQVVYEYGGPYKQIDAGVTNGWGEIDVASPAGGRGLWVAEVQVLKNVATLLHQYKIYGGDSADVRRNPVRHEGDFDVSSQTYFTVFFSDNVTYKAAPAVLDSGDAVMLQISYVDRSTVTALERWLFLDVLWFKDGIQRSSNVLTSPIKRKYLVGGVSGDDYLAHLTALDAGGNECRFGMGAATDGEIVVMPAFSSFRPGEAPLLTVFVADKVGVTTKYTGTPGFAMYMASCLDEQVDIGYVVNPSAPPPDGTNPARFWTIPAGDGQVSYIGNHKFMFYVSTQWTTPGPGPYFFTPSGNTAVATFNSATGFVELAGVINPTLSNMGDQSPDIHGAFVQSLLTQIYNSPRPGRIEVVRPESDGYQPAANGAAAIGHPATLIFSIGRGNAGPSASFDDGVDIKDGSTAISYDSGKTWTTILQYGSPAGAFHCGNIAQARSEPVVRV